MTYVSGLTEQTEEKVFKQEQIKIEQKKINKLTWRGGVEKTLIILVVGTNCIISYK